MSKIAHTAGPWSLSEVRTDAGRAFRIGAGEMLAAGKGCCIIYDDYPGSLENERKANARLISAAPDLLAALETILEICEVGDEDRIREFAENIGYHETYIVAGHIAAAKAAISKAKGEA